MLTEDRDVGVEADSCLEPAPEAQSSTPRSPLQRLLRRRRFIVNPRLQVRLLAYSLSYVVLSVAALGVSLFTPLGIRMLTSELDSTEALRSSTQFLYIHARFWPVGFLAVLCIGLHSILSSHRIAGPLFRLRRTLEQVRAGNFEPTLSARSTDLITEEIDEVNRTVDALRDKLAEVKDAYRELDQAIEEGVTSGLLTTSSDITSKRKRLGETIAYFRLQH